MRHPSAILLAITTVAAFTIACDKGDGDTSTPTPSVAITTPVATASPTPPPPDPTLADTLRYEGDFEGAARVYASIVTATTGQEQHAALLGQAQMLLRSGLPDEARAPLEAHVAALGAEAPGTTGQFLLASTFDDLGEDATAADLYQSYLTASGDLSSYARIELAKLFASLGRVAEAEAAGLEVLADPEVADLLGSFTLSMGRAYRSAGFNQEAQAWLGRVASFDGDVAAAAFTAGEIKREIGDPTWSDDFLAMLAAYPEGDVAGEMLAALDEAAIAVRSYLRGLVAYRAFDNAAARTSLDEAVAASDAPAEASYYLGALSEREGDDTAAAAQYRRSVEFDPQSTLASSALWWRGRILERDGQYDAALQAYTQLAADHPGSTWAGEAAFHRGLVRYLSGDPTGAAAVWAEIAPRTDSEGYRARLWQGRALRESGDPLGEAVLRLLADDPAAAGDYYALRAASLLQEPEEQRPFVPVSAGPPDWDAIAALVAASTGLVAPSTAPAQDILAPPSLDVATDLEAVGLRGHADRLRGEAIAGASSDPAALLAIVRRFYDDRDASYAARAATALLAVAGEGDDPARLELLRLAYPQPYAHLVVDTSTENGLDILLLYALIRQESLYDPDAGSVAGALGLTQVIPPTGEAIAVALGVEGFEPRDLFRPAVSLRFGANYLASQTGAFEGNVHHALAAYNGGPGASDDAIAAASDDVDLFVESLEFDETRLYVRRVLEHYAQYRYIYAGLDRPSLPR